MKIVIAGASSCCEALIKILTKERHQLTIIDNNKELVNEFAKLYNVDVVCANVISYDVLNNLNLSNIDIFIAITSNDDTNILAASIAKTLGSHYVMAKIDSLDLSSNIEDYKRLYNIDFIYNPKQFVAEEIVKLIELPSSVGIEAFLDVNSVIVNVKIDNNSILLNKKLFSIKEVLPYNMLIIAIKKNNKVIIPKGNDIIEAGDEIALLATKDDIKAILNSLLLNKKKIKNVFIVGCGDIGSKLIPLLNDKKLNISIVDNNIDKCKELIELYPNIAVSYGDGIDENTLLEEGIKKSDCCISLTDADEKNITISLFAWYCGVQSIITKINSISYSNLLHKININRTISKEELSIEAILHFIKNISILKSGITMSNYNRIYDGDIELLEYIIDKEFDKLNIEFKNKEFSLKDNCIIAGIVRDNNFIIPNGNSMLTINDKVIVISLAKNKIKSLKDVFKKA